MKDSIIQILVRIKIFIFSILSEVLFYFSGRKNKNQSEIENLKGIYAGKRCFMVGNGPSLTAEDLNKIEENQDFSFAFNRISKIFSQTSWRPTFYCVFDEGAPRKLRDLIAQTEAEKKFFRKSSFLWTKNVPGNCIFLPTDGSRNLLQSPRFSDDISRQVYTIGTVTYAAIQIAAYMGFTEIFLIGTDHNYASNKLPDGTIQKNSNTKGSYFGENSIKDKNYIGSPWEMTIAFEAAKEYAERTGIKIFNATRGGKLEVFQRMDFDSLF